MFPDIDDTDVPELGRFDTFHHEADAQDPEPDDRDFDDGEMSAVVV